MAGNFCSFTTLDQVIPNRSPQQQTRSPQRMARLAAMALLVATQASRAADGCTTGACLTPSPTQAAALFARVEALWPQYFAPASATQSTMLGTDLAYYRRYANALSAGLATYQGGIWYTLGADWTRYSSLDDANREVCNSACWTSTASTAGHYSYPLVDTSQSRTFNASAEIAAPGSGQGFFGQDAQTNGLQPSYTLSGDGKTVLDNITQLTWMRGPNTTLTTPVITDKKTWSQAQALATSINASQYGGYSDWRLPTIKELYSLVRFTGTDASSYTGTNTTVLTPFIDTNYFNFGYGQPPTERIIDAQYASSNLFAYQSAENGSPMLFGLNLADGRIKGYDTITSESAEKTFFVQLVRGQAGYGVNQFVANANGTVLDQATGLTWSQRDSESAMTWEQALAWVQTMNAANYLEHNDWRMPNAKELQSIVNYANAPDANGKPAIDTNYFFTSAITNENGEADYPYFWTSTTHVKYAGNASVVTGAEAVYIPFGRALGYSTRQAKWVDVHGAGAQRSDPKVGPPYSYATTYTVSRSGINYTGYAFGPQRDAIRGRNYVRLVR